MNQVHHIATRLLDSPIEIILDILSHLDVYDLVRARRVCNDIRQAIDSSSELLYSMDLEYFNAILVPSIPGSDYSIPTLRKSLLQSESAWQKAEYSKRNPIAIPHPPSMHKWSCGVLGFPVESPQQLMFFQPQLADGHSNTMNLRQWSCQLDSAAALRLVHYNFSLTEDLVTLIVGAPSGESHAYDVIFRSLSEDKVHREAAFPSVKALDNEVDLELLNPYTLRSSIFGDYYGVLFRSVNKANGGVADFLQIWNWKSKDTFQCLEVFDPACKTMNFSFLTNERILVVNARELLLYSLIHASNALQLTAKFSLPALHSPFEYACIGFSPIPSHACAHNQMIALSMDISGGPLTKNPCFTSYVERNTLLKLESTYVSCYGKATEDSPNLPWSSWGPDHTRSFEESSFDPCKHSVIGFRTASLVGNQNSKRPLCIRDFNPYRVMDFKVGNGTKRNQRLVEGGEILPNLSLFLEPLGSGLPYLETTTEEKFLSTDMTMEVNRVTLLSFEVMDTIRMPNAGGQSFVEHELLQGFEVLDFE
ncbi:uncharacterized protein HD556DRAFT_1049897 [Suillus plorans]|uniref:F-box domain-containing protein n=1 Tax=Suillus plorans TaxID=116603 RepID=A0A9P7AC52_9AGAM|nr:uncharacterized protein HD556DRAFT_1049897 [Suillus plorans]KAG1786436.1 hypothetical protein HD556DRAFT_1049897 [Suillus plorans]